MAAMAYDAYRPSLANYLDPGNGWAPEKGLSDANRMRGLDDGTGYQSGFDASVWHEGNSQVVIAFRGTDLENGPVPAERDFIADYSAGSGSDSLQVFQAIQAIADAQAKYPGAQILLTGHSLGGGLASIMAVFFDLPAYVFAPAPFEFSATDVFAFPDTSVGVALTNSDQVQRYYNKYQMYQLEKWRYASFDPTFKAYADAFSTGLETGRALFSDRETRVAGTFIRGEILEPLRGVIPTIGEDQDLKPIDIGQSSLGTKPGALHSIVLHAALVNSPSLLEAANNLPHLLELLTDKGLYANGRLSARADFLTKLLNLSLPSVGETTELDQFGSDLLKLGTQGKTQVELLERALTAATIEYCREHLEDPAAPAPFFSSIAGGLEFDAQALSGRGEDDKGLDELRGTIRPLLSVNTFTEIDRINALSISTIAQEWSVQAGVAGLTTVGQDLDEVQIGGASVENSLSGGRGRDLLIGWND